MLFNQCCEVHFVYSLTKREFGSVQLLFDRELMCLNILHHRAETTLKVTVMGITLYVISSVF